MARRNHRPDLNGLLVIDKPLRWTSAKTVASVRRHTQGAKVGHAGTLDPLATGVLVLCLGRATRTVPAIMAQPKRYRATLDLSATSPTDDHEAQPIPAHVDTPPTTDDLRTTLTAFLGEIQQTPPAHSAIKVAGRRAYHLARAGNDPALEPRTVRIDAIDILDYRWPLLTLDVRCGKGTYIRSLARDLGVALGTGGMLHALRRTAVGPWTEDLAHAPDQLPHPFLPDHLLPTPPPDPAPAS